MSIHEIRTGQEDQQQTPRTKTYELLFVLKTGGTQPLDAIASEINRYFTGNYAKAWAMKDGFMPTFKAYREGKIIFDLITDSRFRGQGLLLSKWVAEKYKQLVNVLKEAEYFEVEHFVTTGQIGYNVKAGGPAEEMERLNRLVKETNASLPTEPRFIHYGRLR